MLHISVQSCSFHVCLLLRLIPTTLGIETITLFLGSAETKICLRNMCIPTSQLRSSAGWWDSLELRTCWTPVISTHIKKLFLLPFLVTGFFLSCWWEESLSLLSRYFPQVSLSLMAILPYYVYFPGSQRMLMNVKPTFLSVAGFPNVVRAVDCCKRTC